MVYNKNYLSAGDFIDVEKLLYRQGYYTNDLSSTSYPIVSPVVAVLNSSLPQNQKDSQIDAFRTIDSRKELEKYFYRRSVDQQYNVSLRGGGINNDYFLSAGYDRGLSNQIGNGSRRFTLNTSSNVSLTEKLDFSIGLNFIQTSGKAA
ncbi:hypothetical protein [Chryseobacterium polytrichastri]|uniref:hypothetical protein n=1 Tax=Chryseobacterium polytrichastri TaxID=1302687 RepID=UPI000934B6AE|nr:hypothetical protein [Chryseobacterium polytrichastri]